MTFHQTATGQVPEKTGKLDCVYFMNMNHMLNVIFFFLVMKAQLNVLVLLIKFGFPFCISCPIFTPGFYISTQFYYLKHRYTVYGY